MSEEVVCEITAEDEIKAVGEMLARAGHFGLTAEVVWSFGNAAHGAVTMAQACAAALREWDL